MGEKEDMLKIVQILYIPPKDSCMVWRGGNQGAENTISLSAALESTEDEEQCVCVTPLPPSQ